MGSRALVILALAAICSTRAAAQTSWTPLKLDSSSTRVWFDSASLTRSVAIVSVRFRIIESPLVGVHAEDATVWHLSLDCSRGLHRLDAGSLLQGDRVVSEFPPSQITGEWKPAVPGWLEDKILGASCARWPPARG